MQKVPAFCLKVSEVFEPMSGNDEVMTSHDGVVTRKLPHSGDE